MNLLSEFLPRQDKINSSNNNQPSTKTITTTKNNNKNNTNKDNEPALLVPPSSGLATTAWAQSGTFSLIHLVIKMSTMVVDDNSDQASSPWPICENYIHF